MLSTTKLLNSGEADEQVQQRGLEFHLSDDVCGHLLPPVPDGLYPEIALASKNECDYIDWESVLPNLAGMET